MGRIGCLLPYLLKKDYRAIDYYPTFSSNIRLFTIISTWTSLSSLTISRYSASWWIWEPFVISYIHFVFHLHSARMSPLLLSILLPAYCPCITWIVDIWSIEWWCILWSFFFYYLSTNINNYHVMLMKDSKSLT